MNIQIFVPLRCCDKRTSRSDWTSTQQDSFTDERTNTQTYLVTLQNWPNKQTHIPEHLGMSHSSWGLLGSLVGHHGLSYVSGLGLRQKFSASLCLLKLREGGVKLSWGGLVDLLNCQVCSEHVNLILWVTRNKLLSRLIEFISLLL